MHSFPKVLTSLDGPHPSCATDAYPTFRLYKLLMRSFLMTFGKNQEMQLDGTLYNYSLEPSNDKCALSPQFNVFEGIKQRGKKLKDPCLSFIYWDYKPYEKSLFLPPSFSLPLFVSPVPSLLFSLSLYPYLIIWRWDCQQFNPLSSKKPSQSPGTSLWGEICDRSLGIKWLTTKTGQ